MSSGELARNPQNPPLLQTLQESANLVNELATGFNVLDIPVAETVYDLYRQEQPEPGRQVVSLHWKSGDKLITSDGRSVTSMRLDVAKSSDAPSSEPVQTYRLACAFDETRWQRATITVDTAQQQVDIVNEQPVKTPVYWKPISEPDIESIVTVFHDALLAAKPIDEDKKREIREHNELLEYVKLRWPNGFPSDNSAS